MRLKGIGTFAAALLSSSSLIAIAAPAAAAAPETTATPADATSVAEVVVTARKQSERLIDVPAPVSAIGGEALQEQGAVKFTDYLNTVPGVNFESGREGATVLILRGVATGAANPTVATYIDEAPFGSSTIFALGSALTPDIDPGDIDHIELLRGPQGTLYGANAIGGILKFVTKAPDTTEFGGRIEVSGQSVSGGGTGGGIRGSVNVPLITDKLAVRISGYDRDDPGYIDDVLHNQKNINDTRVSGGRLEVLWKPADNLQVRLSALSHNLVGQDSNGMDVQQVGTCATCNSGSVGGPTYGDLKVARYLPEPLDVHFRLYDNTVTWSPGPVTLVSATSYSTQHIDQTSDLTAQFGPVLHAALPTVYPAGIGATLLREIKQSKFTQELRLSSAGQPKLEWQVGAYFTHERSTANDPATLFTVTDRAPFVLPPALGAFQNIFDATLYSRYTEISGFGDVDYHFTSKFDVTVGARYSSDQQTFTQPASGILFGAASTAHATGDESAFTFLINPRYKLSDDSTLYARIASGYRPGGPNTVPPAALNFPTTFGPDFLTNYEAGWKAELLDHKLSVDTSVFFLQWNKMQLPTVIGGFSAEANGGKAHSEGVESQVTWTPVAGLTLGANATYTDAVMDSNTPFAGAFKGNGIPLVPRWNWGASGDYSHALANDWTGYVGATYRYVGKRPNVFVFNTPTTGYYLPLPSYDSLDLRAGVTRDQWTVQAFIRNVTDERGATSVGSNPGIARSPDLVEGIIQPRTFGLSLSKNF
jgi:outer membrane receptor protein involved in Fe transport